MKSELTLLIDSANFAALARHPIWHRHACAPPLRRQLASRYFDTQEFDLWQVGFALRVCRINRKWVQVLEHRGRQLVGLRQYHAWQTPAKVGLPDVVTLLESGTNNHVIKDMLPPKLRRLLLAKPMAPVFSARSQYTSHVLRIDGWDQIEAKIGHVELQCDEQRVPSCEIVLSLLSGDPGCLYRFAQELLAITPFRLSHVSPAERGHEMRMSRPAEALRAGKVSLDSSMSVQQALHEIIANCGAQIQANEVGVISGTDPEYIHQMRVSLRRLNSAFGLFRDLVPCPAALREALSQTRRDLGAARDWEVLARDTLGRLIEERRAVEGLGRLQKVIQREAEKHRKQAASLVLSERYTQNLLALGAWGQQMLGQPPAVIDANAAETVELGIFVRQVMDRRDSQLRRRAKQLRGADDETRHEMRLSAKKLRYAVEFFGALYPAIKLRAYVDELAEMQEMLGLLNDAVVADRLLRQKPLGGAELAPIIGFVRGYLAARSLREVRALAQLWKRFKKLRFPAKN